MIAEREEQRAYKIAKTALWAEDVHGMSDAIAKIHILAKGDVLLEASACAKLLSAYSTMIVNRFFGVKP